jgi:hypothetical protein
MNEHLVEDRHLFRLLEVSLRLSIESFVTLNDAFEFGHFLFHGFLFPVQAFDCLQEMSEVSLENPVLLFKAQFWLAWLTWLK